MTIFERFSRIFALNLGERPPKILLMPDRRGWIFDKCARAIAKHLDGEFEFSIRYVEDGPHFDGSKYDLVYVFFWGEAIYKGMNVDPQRLVKHVASHRWEDNPAYGPCTARQFGWRYLRDCSGVHCTSKKLEALIKDQHPLVRTLPSGYETEELFPSKRRSGPLVVGWAGNAADGVKQVDTVLVPACQGAFDLRLASGSIPSERMNDFYNRCDVIAIASRHEGHPMPLIEGMAAGCFPVTTDVGLASEIIVNGQNGLIVTPTREAFREALSWCAANIEHVRAAGMENASLAKRKFAWPVLKDRYSLMFREMLHRASAPRFRNDDVSADTPLHRFKEFCEIFWRHGYTQLHGVTLNGRTCDFYTSEGYPVPYPGVRPLSEVPNEVIRSLAVDTSVAEQPELVAFLNASPDELALHGLYHVDHSVMGEAELRADISQGLEIMQRIFPRKLVRYFIPPFNRSSAALQQVCREFDLHVLGTDGVHLEEAIEGAKIEGGVWYRYHHHRFYPESTCRYYPTTFATLEAALKR